MPALSWLLLLALANPQAHALRLASTSPQVTELLYDLGKGGDLAAVGAFSHYPKEASRLPVLGSLFFPSIETAVTLGIEVIAFDLMNASPSFAQAADAMGMRRYGFEMTSVETLVSDSQRFLQGVYGEKSHPRLDRVLPCVSAYRPSRKFTFLALTWFQPPIAFGDKTFVSNVLTHLGGTNVLAPLSHAQFPRLSLEWLVTHEVDYIFYLTEYPETVKEARAAAAGWWPKKTPPLIVLGADEFARGGFTPLREADTLSMVEPKTRWKECLEASR